MKRVPIIYFLFIQNVDAFQQQVASLRSSANVNFAYLQKSTFGCDVTRHPNMIVESGKQRRNIRHNGSYFSLESSSAAPTTEHAENEDVQSLKISSMSDGEDVMSESLVANGEDEKRKRKKRLKKMRESNRMKVSLALAAILSAFWTIIYSSGVGAWRYYLAGGICAAVSHAITTPIDVIKTRKQVDESMKDAGLIQTGLNIIKDDPNGIKALLAGLGPTTVGYLFEGAVKFGIYEVMKPIIQSLLMSSANLFNVAWFNSKLLGFMISGSFSGTAASIMLCPMEALRIRLVAEPDFAASGNWVDGGLKMINNEGLMGLWKCLPAMLCKQVPYTVTKNVSFDLMTTFFYGTLIGSGRIICGKTKVVIPLLAAMLASILSCISSQPGDLLLSVMNAHQGELRAKDFVKNIMKEKGINGFFVGIKERFLHVGLIVTVQLLMYDIVKRLVGIAATGL